jgi:hypothetical protein
VPLQSVPVIILYTFLSAAKIFSLEFSQDLIPQPRQRGSVLRCLTSFRKRPRRARAHRPPDGWRGGLSSSGAGAHAPGRAKQASTGGRRA